MSSRTTSISLSCKAFSAAWDVPTVATTSKPSTRPTYAVWASAAIGSSSTTRTRRRRGDARIGRRAIATCPPAAAHGERRPGRARHLERAAEPRRRSARRGRVRCRAGPRCPAPWSTSRAGRRPRPRPAADPARRRRRRGRHTPPSTRASKRTCRSGRGVEGDAGGSGIAGHGVEGVVDEVADDRHDVAGRVRRRSGQCDPGSISKAMPRSWASAALPSSSAVRAGSSTEPTTRSVSSCETCELVGREVERPVGVPELDEADDRVQPVGRLVRLRAQRLGEAAGRVELAGQRLEVGAVAQRRDVAEQPALPAGRAAVEHEHAGGRHVQLVLVGRVVGERGRQRRGRGRARRRAGRRRRRAAPSRRVASSLASRSRPSRSVMSRPSVTACSTAS